MFLNSSLSCSLSVILSRVDVSIVVIGALMSLIAILSLILGKGLRLHLRVSKLGNLLTEGMILIERDLLLSILWHIGIILGRHHLTSWGHAYLRHTLSLHTILKIHLRRLLLKLHIIVRHLLHIVSIILLVLLIESRLWFTELVSSRILWLISICSIGSFASLSLLMRILYPTYRWWTLKWVCITRFFDEVIDMPWVISLLLKLVSASCYSFHQDFSLFSMAYFNAFLYNVVSISVLHHLIENSILIKGLTFIFKVLFEKLFNEKFFINRICML